MTFWVALEASVFWTIAKGVKKNELAREVDERDPFIFSP